MRRCELLSARKRIPPERFLLLKMPSDITFSITQPSDQRATPIKDGPKHGNGIRNMRNAKFNTKYYLSANNPPYPVNASATSHIAYHSFAQLRNISHAGRGYRLHGRYVFGCVISSCYIMHQWTPEGPC